MLKSLSSSTFFTKFFSQRFSFHPFSQYSTKLFSCSFILSRSECTSKRTPLSPVKSARLVRGDDRCGQIAAVYRADAARAHRMCKQSRFFVADSYYFVTLHARAMHGTQQRIILSRTSAPLHLSVINIGMRARARGTEY